MSKTITTIIAFIIGIILTVFIGINTLPGFMIKEVASPYGFKETLAKVKAKAKSIGWKVPKKWNKDFRKNLQKTVKIDVGHVTVLKMCEPQAAADILIHDKLKRLSVLMPCSVAVYNKSDGKTYIAIMNMGMLGALFGDTVKGITNNLAPQMEEMINLSED